jgi:hypothetical protein
MTERPHDREDLTETIRIVRAACPGASMLFLSTSDQGTSGFELDDVLLDGTKLSQSDGSLLDQIADDTWHLVSSLGWDGLVGEGKYGYAELDIDAVLQRMQGETN